MGDDRFCLYHIIKNNRTMKKFLLLACSCFVLCLLSVRAAEPEEVIYGRKDGMALTMLVQQPATQSNGRGVIVIISGGFKSSIQGAHRTAVLARPLAERGYTTFFVVHGSQPRYAATDAVADVRRAIRFIRYNAARWGIDPAHIGISGGSAGGQTALLMNTQGDDGNPQAEDPVERMSSRVQAVACFFPLTDFLHWNYDNDAYGLGTKLWRHQTPYAFTRLNKETNTYEYITDSLKIREIAHRLSPIYYVDSHTAPTLIAHGDQDKAIDLEQSQRFIKKLEEAGIPCRLIVKPGGPHGAWDDTSDYYSRFADWFDRYLFD